MNESHNEPRALVVDVPSDLELVDGLWDQVGGFIEQRRLSKLKFTVELVLRECLTNAIVHGNRRDKSKRVQTLVIAEKTGVMISVADEGQGFDWRSSRFRRVPDESATSGRGLWIVAAYARRMTFNRAGNEIEVEIGCQAAGE